jgi:DNA repair protein RadC
MTMTTTFETAREPESETVYQSPAYVPSSSPPPQDPRTVIGNAADVWSHVAVRAAAQDGREHMIVFYLDVRHRILDGGPYTLAIGSICGVEVHPRECFRKAIAVGATACILVHNHPSGDTSPSRQDLELTARLRQVGELVGVQVLDHIIVAAGGYVSLADRGWL